MNYFIVPKNNDIVNIFLKYNTDTFISKTAFHYFKNLRQIVGNYDFDVIALINIPTVKYSYNIFNLIEIIKTFYLFDTNDNIVIYSAENIDPLLSIFRKNKTDTVISDSSSSLFDFGILSIKEYNIKSFNFLLNQFIYKLNKNGSYIIKINSIFSQHTIDFIYILSIIFDKVFIMKPKINNVLSLERYIICKNLSYDFKSKPVNCFYNPKPLFFIKKIEEINIMLMNNQCTNIIYFLNKLSTTNKDILENNNSLKYIEWSNEFLSNKNIGKL
jgi:hypothetical protein